MFHVDGRTDRQTDMTKLIAAFRNSANAPETPSNALTSMLHSYPWTDLDRPLGLQEVKTLRISRQSAPEGGQVVIRTDRLYPQKTSLVLVDPRATVQPEGLSKSNIPMTLSRIEPAAFRFVAQCPNQLSHRVPPKPDCSSDVFPRVYFPAVLIHCLPCSNTSHLFQLHDVVMQEDQTHILHTLHSIEKPTRCRKPVMVLTM